jgi:hypothetical protein
MKSLCFKAFSVFSLGEGGLLLLMRQLPNSVCIYGNPLDSKKLGNNHVHNKVQEITSNDDACGYYGSLDPEELGWVV